MIRNELRYILLLCLTLLASIGTESVLAQGPAQSIFDVLLKNDGRKGRITITQSDYIRGVVGRRPAGLMTVDDQEGFTKIRGYRIQVYSGNRTNSKSIAEQRERHINETNPEYNTYVIYNAPFWRLHIGNFLSYQEAQAAVRQLKADFPTYAKQMIVVRDMVFVSQ